MKSLKLILCSSVAIVGLSTGASAQTFSPNGVRTLSNVGTITVSKGITLACSGLTGTAEVTGGVGTIETLSLSGGLLGQCANITFANLDYELTATSTSAVTINNVRVEAITGNCEGNITGTFNDTADTITFSNAVLPRISGSTQDCRISGTIKISPAITFTIP